MPFHKLEGSEARYAVEVSGNYRLLFDIANEPIPTKNDDPNAIDRVNVTKIRIHELAVDYHGN